MSLNTPRKPVVTRPETKYAYDEMSHKKFAGTPVFLRPERKPTALSFIALDVTPRPSSPARAEERAVRWAR